MAVEAGVPRSLTGRQRGAGRYLPPMDPDTPSTHPVAVVQKVLFVCPHGAAKSVLAGSYFNHLASRVGLKARATARGTEPDAEIADRVRQDVGAALCVDRPTLLSAADVADADLLVAFDLAEPDLGAAPDRSWNALPALSADFELGRAAILGRVVALVAELKAQAEPGGA
jgi:arsenate reductase (thioredoxin)